MEASATRHRGERFNSGEPLLYISGVITPTRDTVIQELEKQASRKLRINAKETMRLAEKLYTQG